MKIATSGQNFWRTDQVTAGRRANVTPIQCMQDPVDFIVFAHEAINLGERLHELNVLGRDDY